ncbi:T-cell receptor delta chain C region [Fukomys damarensis]|nr:T-cell receptor delta chain C region [Fukomys damarensis]
MKNGSNVACLVKDFYPKTVNINLRSSKKVVEFDPAVVISPSGKYSAVKLGQYEDPNSVTCSVQINNETVSSTDFEVKTNSSDVLRQTEPTKVTQTEKSCHEPKVINKTEPAVYRLKDPKSSDISVCLFTDFGSDRNVSELMGPEMSNTEKTVLDMKSLDSKSNGAVAWSNKTNFECSDAFPDDEFYPSSDMNLNLQNLTVMGLRIFLLKVAGFNLLMTLRLWSS